MQAGGALFSHCESGRTLQQLALAGGVLGLVAPLALCGAARARDLNLNAISAYQSDDQITSLSQISDVKPGDWAYQALHNLIERYGCVAGYPNGSDKGSQAMSRFEAAALLHACLDRVTTFTDELNKLMAEFAAELAVLKGRAAGLEARADTLRAQQFSTTTKLSVDAYMVLGGNRFLGSAGDLVTASSNHYGAVTFNYDIRINLQTSFNGNDLLRTRLRAGNFDRTSNSFYGAGPSHLSQLESSFEEHSGPNRVAIDRLYYQFPVGKFTLTLGGVVEQDDMLAMFPSVYPNSSVLDMFTMAGAPVAYDLNIGQGAGLWWRDGAWSVSVSYIAQDGDLANPAEGGIGTLSSRSSTTVQLGYQQPQWGMALVYSAMQQDVAPYSTKFLESSLTQFGLVHTVGLSGYWQPISNGWIPSISAGAELSQFDYSQQATNAEGRNASTEAAWSVGLQWLDVLAAGNSAGMAMGQAPHATSLVNGAGVNDSNWMWEWWYRWQVSDALSVTPALFYLSRPLGQDTPAGQSFNQLGALVKTQFRF